MTSFRDLNDAINNLCGHAVNQLVEKQFGDLFLKVMDKPHGYIETVLCGKPSIINWSSFDGMEVRISVWWDLDKTTHPYCLEGGFKHLEVVEFYRRDGWGSDNLDKTQILKDSAKIERFMGIVPTAPRATYPEFVGMVVCFWLELEKGKYIQTAKAGVRRSRLFTRHYLRNTTKKEIMHIEPCTPNGFQLVGPFQYDLRGKQK